jgi:N-acetylglutamate synthase-like GNAT family acetyltransferase
LPVRDPPTAFSLRKALATDRATIRRLVYQARLNPRGLDWRRFVVAVDERQRVIGCGQIKPHRDGSRELASIVVEPGRQLGGVGSAVIARLLATGPPLWLVCRSKLVPFYRRFGFREIDEPQASRPHFRRMLRLGRWLERLLPPGDVPRVMVWESELPDFGREAKLQTE